MKKICLIPVLLICFSQGITAQVGISALYSVMSAPDWDQPQNVDGNSFPFKGLVFSADYWFRLKETRVEFMPTLSYRSLDYGDKFKSYSFHFNTNFYVLDLFGDCDCPTFTKSEPVIRKGLFVQISPGYTIASITYAPEDGSFPGNEASTAKDNTSFGDIGLGLGLDIGVSNLITVSPLVRYRFGFGGNWDEAPAYDTENSTKSALSWYEFGIRLGIRFDAGKY